MRGTNAMGERRGVQVPGKENSRSNQKRERILKWTVVRVFKKWGKGKKGETVITLFLRENDFFHEGIQGYDGNSTILKKN